MNAPPPPYPPPAQPYPPAPGYAPPPPKKKGGNGCLIALGVVGVFILLVGAVVAFFAYRFANSPDGKKIVSAVASGTVLLAEATRAPGTKELRALGCSTAMVFDASQVEALAKSFGDGGTVKVSAGARLEVICALNVAALAPTCDRVASTYVGAVGQAAGPFVVTVGVSGQNPTCEERYAATGERFAQPEVAPR